MLETPPVEEVWGVWEEETPEIAMAAGQATAPQPGASTELAEMDLPTMLGPGGSGPCQI